MFDFAKTTPSLQKNSATQIGRKRNIFQDVYLKSQKYSHACSRFSFVKTAFAFAKELGFIQLDILPKIWSLASTVSLHLSKISIIGRIFSASLISQSIIFFVITTAISSLESLPFSYYESFVLEKKFGFNKCSIKTWSMDSFKSFAVNALLVPPFNYGFFKIVDRFETSFVSYGCGFVFIAELALITILPNVVYHFFYKFTLIEEGELKHEIEALAKRNKFNITNIHVMNASSRTSHSNAFFVGLPWAKKIVLFDTLIEKMTTAQMIFVLTHELGHWKLNHSPQMLLFHQFLASINLALFSGFLRNKSFFHAFGFTDASPAYIGFYLFTYVGLPLSCATQFLGKLLSRKNVYEADAFAKDQGSAKEMATALIKLKTENMGAVDNDWLYSAYNHSHPTLIERLNALGYDSNEKVGDIKLKIKRHNDK